MQRMKKADRAILDHLVALYSAATISRELARSGAVGRKPGRPIGRTDYSDSEKWHNDLAIYIAVECKRAKRLSVRLSVRLASECLEADWGGKIAASTIRRMYREGKKQLASCTNPEVLTAMVPKLVKQGPLIIHRYKRGRRITHQPQTENSCNKE